MKVLRILCLFVALTPVLSAQPKTYVLRAARAFDSASGSLVQPGSVVVAGGRIRRTPLRQTRR
jgi:hypothetical protein